MNIERTWIYGAAGVLLATAATVTAYALLTGEDDPTAIEEPDVADSPTGAAQPAPDPTSGSRSDDVAVPVYYLGEVTFPQGEGGETQTAYRLYREWYAADATSAETAAAGALERMFAPPTDPDYTSPWNPGVDVLSVTHEDGVVSVDLTGPVQDVNIGAESAELAVQQLIHTVQGALSVMDEAGATDPVQLLLDGERAGDLWGHVDASEPVARAAATGVRSPIWITSPQDGSTVAMPLTVTGVAQVFEASVSWRVLQGGKQIADGFTSASEGAPAIGTYEFKVRDLPPGEYVLEVFEASALDGSSIFVDSKRIRVE